MSAKTLSEIIEELSPEYQGGRFLSDPVSVVVSLRVPLEYRILLDVIAKKAGRTRSAFAGDLLIAGLIEIRRSDSFGIESIEEFKRECLKAGVFLDEFMTEEEQYELQREEEEQYEQQLIKEGQKDMQKEKQNKQEGGQKDVSA